MRNAETQAAKKQCYLIAIGDAAHIAKNQAEMYSSMSRSATWPWKKKEYQIRAATAFEIFEVLSQNQNKLTDKAENEIFTPWYERDLPQSLNTGVVRWFRREEGHGYIQPKSGDFDIFVGMAAVERAGLSTLNTGQTIEYEVVSRHGGRWEADNLKIKRS
ncbi:MAG: cold shock protein [Alphaproteobacteria bacterium]|jgi:CspA family cold shock protein|nr:cold shock protein [Alphaproteobacteria bacterium]